MQADINYNWDDIEVGSLDLNHSENFFAKKHLKHEKFTDEFEAVAEEEFQKLEAEVENQENEPPNINQNQICADIKVAAPVTKEPSTVVTPTVKTEPKSPQQPNSIKKILHEKFQKNMKEEENQENQPPAIQNLQTVKNEKSTLSISSGKKPPKVGNIMRQPWGRLKSPQPGCTAKSKSAAMPLKNGKVIAKASVYDFKDIYQKKKEEKMKQLLEEEKKNRVFHSRPVPNFNAFHEHMARKQQSVPLRVTDPHTPMVLKKSKETDEKRRQRLEEWKKRNQPVKFTSRDPASVLQAEPFKPKKAQQSLEPQPFNLHVEKRVQERKLYDEQIKRSTEEKNKQDEEERRKREEEKIKELRKQTSFKARPNPFK